MDNGTLLRNLRYSLVFRKGRYSVQQPAEDMWNQFRYDGTRSYRTMNEFCQDWIAATTLPSNRSLQVLHRVEGGICNSDESRQIRFRPIYDEWGSINAQVRNGHFSIEELVDLRNAFVKVMDLRLQQVSTNPEMNPPEIGGVRVNYTCEGQLVIK